MISRHGNAQFMEIRFNPNLKLVGKLGLGGLL